MIIMAPPQHGRGASASTWRLMAMNARRRRGQKAEMADAHKATLHHMQQEPPKELVGRNGHFALMRVSVGFPVAPRNRGGQDFVHQTIYRTVIGFRACINRVNENGGFRAARLPLVCASSGWSAD
jgi:hypothetical protein